MGKKGKNGDISREDALLWAKITKKDNRLEGKGVSIPEEEAQDSGQPTKNQEKIDSIPPTTQVSKPIPESKSLPEYPPIDVGEVKGVDRSTAEKLKRGQLKIEAQLDLHGMTQEEAAGALYSFIMLNYEAQKRCVLVITGKGTQPDGSIGVLRENVPRWLNAPGIRPYILAFTHAQPKDGGEGALYVLLRRRR